MNRRATRVREIYGWALVAGIGHDEAARMTPGYVIDMYMLRAKYDARMTAQAGAAGLARRLLGG